MRHPVLTRHEFERRQQQLADLQRYVAEQEQSFHFLHISLQAFVDRYIDLLGPLYLELDALESQLHSASVHLAEALRRNGLAAPLPTPPRATALPRVPRLPEAAPLPQQPAGEGVVEVEPPSLKQLYRRAAMRLHPDLAPNELLRRRREQAMMEANQAYAEGNRFLLERLLLEAGEDPLKVTGSNGDAVLEWLRRSELAVQGRLRVVQAHLVALQAHPMHQLMQAIEGAEGRGLAPFEVMQSRLRTQISQRRQELYIGQRLQPESELAVAFLTQRVERMGASAY